MNQRPYQHEDPKNSWEKMTGKQIHVECHRDAILGCYNEEPQIRWLKKTHTYFSQSGGWKPEIKVLV